MATKKSKKQLEFEGGFLQLPNSYFDLILSTEINLYGIIILAKIQEYDRSGVQCIVSNEGFAALLGTSESMVKRQIKFLTNYDLICKEVITAHKSHISRIRLLTPSKDVYKKIEKIIQTKGHSDPMLVKELSTSKGQGDPTLSSEARVKVGGNVGSNRGVTLGHSDPIIIKENKESNNNKYLDEDKSSSHGSTPNGADNINLSLSCYSEEEDILEEKELSEKEISMAEYRKKREKVVEDNIDTFWTELNPIRKYYYERKYQDTAKYQAWGDKFIEDNQPNRYSKENIYYYFKQENNLDWLKNYSTYWFDKIVEIEDAIKMYGNDYELIKLLLS